MYPSVTKDTRVRRVYGLVDYLHKIKTSVYSAVLQSYPKQTVYRNFTNKKLNVKNFKVFREQTKSREVRTSSEKHVKKLHSILGYAENLQKLNK